MEAASGDLTAASGDLTADSEAITEGMGGIVAGMADTAAPRDLAEAATDAVRSAVDIRAWGAGLPVEGLGRATERQLTQASQTAAGMVSELASEAVAPHLRAAEAVGVVAVVGDAVAGEMVGVIPAGDGAGAVGAWGSAGAGIGVFGVRVGAWAGRRSGIGHPMHTAPGDRGTAISDMVTITPTEPTLRNP
jgi:hypothetical protein